VDHLISLPTTYTVYHTETENFYNLSTVPETLIKLLINMSTLRCNNWSQSFPKLSDCPINQIRQT